MITPLVISLLCTLIVAFFAYKLFGSKKKTSPNNQAPTHSGQSTTAEENPLLHRALNPEEYNDCTVYNLVNCVHCDRLKNFLSENNIPYTPIMVDNFSNEDRQNVMHTLRSYNPRGSFPTLVTPEGEVLVGFREWQAKALLIPENNEKTENQENAAQPVPEQAVEK